MRFYTKQQKFYYGIDLHARTMYLCVLNQHGEILLHRNMKAAPEPFLQAIAGYREDLVVCVECIFTWYWLADLCTREGSRMPYDSYFLSSLSPTIFATVAAPSFPSGSSPLSS